MKYAQREISLLLFELRHKIFFVIRGIQSERRISQYFIFVCYVNTMTKEELVLYLKKTNYVNRVSYDLISTYTGEETNTPISGL